MSDDKPEQNVNEIFSSFERESEKYQRRIRALIEGLYQDSVRLNPPYVEYLSDGSMQRIDTIDNNLLNWQIKEDPSDKVTTITISGRSLSEIFGEGIIINYYKAKIEFIIDNKTIFFVVHQMDSTIKDRLYRILNSAKERLERNHINKINQLIRKLDGEELLNMKW